MAGKKAISTKQAKVKLERNQGPNPVPPNRTPDTRAETMLNQGAPERVNTPGS